jgi:hypothetical protein
MTSAILSNSVIVPKTTLWLIVVFCKVDGLNELGLLRSLWICLSLPALSKVAKVVSKVSSFAL